MPIGSMTVLWLSSATVPDSLPGLLPDFWHISKLKIRGLLLSSFIFSYVETAKSSLEESTILANDHRELELISDTLLNQKFAVLSFNVLFISSSTDSSFFSCALLLRFSRKLLSKYEFYQRL
jgi:hypothetical protein